MKQIVNVAIGILVGFVLAGIIFLVARLPGGEPVTLEPAPTKTPLMVQVSGAVVKPGVYSFGEGSRMQDAVIAAGGLLADADSNQINLVAKLTDGMQLDIPYRAGAAPTAANAPFTVIVTPGSSSSTAGLIDINSATVDQLDSLPGIGPTLAQRIVDYRNQHGKFATTDELMNVSGIGTAIYDNIKNLIVAN